VVAEDPEAFAEEAGNLMFSVIEEAVAARGTASVVLAGGSTPRPAYARLAQVMREAALPIGGITWFFGDERWVARGDPQSNEGMARAALLEPLGAPEQTIVSWDAGAGVPVDRARSYAGRITAAMGTGGPDLVVLGMGADGHTASLFPGATAILPDGRRIPVAPLMGSIAAAIEEAPGRGWRLTLCPDFLRTSRHVVFLVKGSDRRPALLRARGGDPATPAAWIRGACTHYVVTQDALGPEQERG
jgi:6-phosphogluconolactonase